MENIIEVYMDDIIPLMKERFSVGETFTFSPKGVSMHPFIRENKDTVTLSAPPEKLKKFDIALYRRENGKYILHRIVSVGETYTFLGDNCVRLEPCIKREQITAVVSAVNRNGRKVYVTSFWFKNFSRFWYYTRFFRRVYRGLKQRIYRLFKKQD